jgi:hypothetical protein
LNELVVWIINEGYGTSCDPEMIEKGCCNGGWRIAQAATDPSFCFSILLLQ